MKIAIVGTSGSGKTTLAKKLSHHLLCPHIEIDAIAWKPGWIKTPDAEIRQKVRDATNCERWVSCGNYSLTRDIIWKEATHIIWLNLPLMTILWRLIKRSITNIVTKKEIAGGNRETLWLQLFTKNSIFVWALKSHARRKRTYPHLFTSPEYRHVNVTILNSQKEIDRWSFDFLVGAVLT